MKAKLFAAASAALVLASCESCHNVDVSASAAPGTPCDFKKSVTDRVHFAFDKSAIAEKSKAVITAQAEWLKTYPATKATITGMCDERGTREYNLALGNRRAQAVSNALQKAEVEAARLSTISVGKDRPIVANATTEDQHQENRVAVTEISN